MRDIIREVRTLAAKHEVKVKFQRMKGALAGQALLEDNTVLINSILTSRTEILNCFFHELGHLVCHKLGLWKNYHETEDEELRMKTALKAERWCDKWASHMLYAYDARVRFLGCYSECSDEESRKFLEEYYEGN